MPDVDGLQRYAKTVLNAKGIPEDPLGLELTMRSLRESLATTYHAVALDVDGTVTEHVEEGLPKSMVDSLIGVLKHGAYLLFVTGGGRTTANKILHQLTSSLEGRILRRIHAITGSGCHLLSFGADRDIHTERLSNPLRELLGEKPYTELLSNLRDGLSRDFKTQEKACGIRLVSKKDTPIAELSQIVGNRFDSLGEEFKAAGVKLVSGRWGDKPTFDVSSTDKDLALTRFADPPEFHIRRDSLVDTCRLPVV